MTVDFTQIPYGFDELDDVLQGASVEEPPPWQTAERIPVGHTYSPTDLEDVSVEPGELRALGQ